MLAQLINAYARRLVDIVHCIDMAIADRGFISPASMSAIDMRKAEDNLRRIADQLAERRAKLLANDAGQVVLPFLQAAE